MKCETINYMYLILGVLDAHKTVFGAISYELLNFQALCIRDT